MTRGLLAGALIGAVIGWGTAEFLLRAPVGRELVARVYDTSAATRSRRNLQAAAQNEVVLPAAIEQELEVRRSLFADEAQFEQALAHDQLSLGDLRRAVTDDLRARAWIEQQIRGQLAVNEMEARADYEREHARFIQPQRYRVAHLFLAAPEAAPAALKLEQQNKMIALSVRRMNGETLPDLIAEASEDVASKSRAGDLGFFAAERMPSEFMAEIEKLGPGKISAPFRSHLGFHIAEMRAMLPPHELSFEEARPEIVGKLENEKRAAAVAQLTAHLGASSFDLQHP